MSVEIAAGKLYARNLSTPITAINGIPVLIGLSIAILIEAADNFRPAVVGSVVFDLTQ